MAMKVIALLALPLAGCAPMLEMRDGEAADQLRDAVRRFCEAQSTGDVERIAAMFEPALEAAILGAARDGQVPEFASMPGASGCVPGKVWYVGGSRRMIEIRYSGFSDRADIWLSGQGRWFDLAYGETGVSLRERLGLKPRVMVSPTTERPSNANR
ncbi:MAG: hypothetical protein KF910_12410 [Brevundimonas sp.]|uniref:hypothetical protein n=1 Tax=Brevundimonas sp. TaxID=1871086 RepID=UPI0025BB7CD9|nr:hypothetical protein [Brevundimonas sp.]MBX3478408.1 hypothetical protein [Brevundimonas sp.]